MNKQIQYNICILATLLLLASNFSLAQIRSSKLVSDNMVLQRNIENSIWGWTEPGAIVEVEFNDNVYQSIVEEDSLWEIRLPPMEPGGPHTMMIRSKGDKLVVKNILIGDVWICSGQSNMEWTVSNSHHAELEIQRAKDSYIRHFKVPLVGSHQQEKELPGGEWKVSSPETTGDFTAVGYFFARELRNHVGVPIGLINTTWGGSNIEAWMSPDVQRLDEFHIYQEEIRQEHEAERQKIITDLKKKVGHIPLVDEGMIDGRTVWAQVEYDDSDWETMVLPTLWEDAGLDGFDGIMWFRKTIVLPDTIPDHVFELGAGRIDDSDIVWINGRKVGGMTMSWNVDRVYTIPSENLRPGDNVITVRVEDTGLGGGIYGKPELLYLRSETFNLSLAGAWKYKMGEFRYRPNGDNQTPSMLFNHMVHPMLGYGIKGVIWYQGEANANGRQAYIYREQFPLLIEDWRAKWNQACFPFLFVQLANFMEAKSHPEESDWAVLRESQSKALTQCSNTAQVVTIDIGEADDIHPRNKQDVGYRLSLAARKIAYDEDILCSGPVYDSYKIEGRTIRIRFKHTASGLTVRDKYGYPKGFVIAGSDRTFHWAKAKIEGDQIIVWNENISHPVAVRYAWADNPDDANLFNKEGLPASPFRTDDW